MMNEWYPHTLLGITLSPLLWLFIMGLFGLLVGSLLNVIIYRLPIMLRRSWRLEAIEILEETDPTLLNTTSEEASANQLAFNLCKPRSHCPQCKHQVPFYLNIPIASFLWLKGKCGNCQHPISFQYPLVEALTAILFIVTGFFFGLHLVTIFALVYMSALMVVSFIDIDYQIIPDEISMPTLWLGLLVNIPGLLCPLVDAIIGAVVGYLFLWSVYHLFKLLTKKEGMGYGDFKLLALIGAWIGWQPLPFVIIVAAVAGLLIGGFRILKQKQHYADPIPFGPFLAFGGIIMLLWEHIH